MKFVLLLLCLLSVSISHSQDTFKESDARHVVDTFFEGFHAGDTLKMKSVLMDDVPFQTVFASENGDNRISNSGADRLLEAIANRAEDQIWEEKLLSYSIQIDGNLAHVWTPYEFYLNGEFSHCGANAFTLGKTNDGWKILHLIDSRRRGNCRE